MIPHVYIQKVQNLKGWETTQFLPVLGISGGTDDRRKAAWKFI
jgi:hypothetical protein